MSLSEKIKSPLPIFLAPLVYMALGATILIAFLYALTAFAAAYHTPKYRASILSMYGITSAAKKTLDPKFADPDNDLLADAPPAHLCVNPPVLRVVTISSTDGPNPFDVADIGRAIAASTGKKVDTREFKDLKDEVQHMRAGTIDVLIARAAETPYLVNTFGYVPFAVAGDNRGPIGHRMDIVVNAKSPITSIAEIKGRELLCSLPLSIVGCRAAVAYLREVHGLNPDADYQIVFSGNMKRSCIDIDTGKREIAALSNDKLRTLCDDGTISPSHYRVLYESEVLPRFTIGYFYNLKPAVAEQIKAATLAFVGTPPSEKVTPPIDGSIRFVPIAYARDFVTLRQIDDAFDPRMTAKIASMSGPAARKGGD